MSFQGFFFAGWMPILRILIVGTCSYFFLLVSLRAAAPRVLARTNVFDFIIAVGVGSAFGRVLTAKEVALSEACTTFVLLSLLQYLVSLVRVRFPAVANRLDARPQLLYFGGQYFHDVRAKYRLTMNDVEESLRIHGVSEMSEVEAIVLEASGDISILRSNGKKPELIRLMEERRVE